MHDIKVARKYNKTSNSSESAMSRQLAEEISELRDNEERIRSLYRQSYQQTWSPMSTDIPIYQNRDSTISDLEGISLSMEYPTSSPIAFDTYNILAKNYGKRRATLPNTSKISKPNKVRGSTLISDLYDIHRFRLEKIPEVPAGSSSNENDNVAAKVDHSSDSSDTSHSDDPHQPSQNDKSKNDNV